MQRNLWRRQVAEATGQKAVQMIPVDVKSAEVDVESKRVDVDKRRVDEVLRPELEAREKSGKVAQEFELDRLRIDAEARVRIESARASAEIGKNVKMELFGTPDQVDLMTRRLVQGMSAGQFVEGLTSGGNGALNGTGTALKAGVMALAKHLGVPDEVLASAFAGQSGKEGEGAKPALPAAADKSAGGKADKSGAARA